uniref:(northern house mosquito) hypothetical protein n=1 Tax=Culex pipiens TaxID=7175 RepID=A0A8D8L1W5_CULPI
MHRSREHQLIPSARLRDPSVINERERDGCGLCSNFALVRAGRQTTTTTVHGLLLPHTLRIASLALFDVVCPCLLVVRFVHTTTLCVVCLFLGFLLYSARFAWIGYCNLGYFAISWHTKFSAESRPHYF